MSLPTDSSTSGGRMEAGSPMAAITAVSQVGQLARSPLHAARSITSAKRAAFTETSEWVFDGLSAATPLERFEAEWSGWPYVPGAGERERPHTPIGST